MHRDDDLSPANPKPKNPIEKARCTPLWTVSIILEINPPTFVCTNQYAGMVSKMIPYRSARPSAAMIVAWAGFFTLSMFVYALASDGDFSFLLTYAACCRSFGFFLLCFRMFGAKSG